MSQDPRAKRYFIIDFDSTFVRDETVDVLADFALEGRPEKAKVLQKVATITKRGMEGKIRFSESLRERLKLFAANREHLKKTIAYLASRVTPSIERNKEFFRTHADSVYIISNGFKECILPIAKAFGLKAGHVLANSARFDRKGMLVGVKPGVLAEGTGKVEAVKALRLKGEVVVVGDGSTDLAIRSSGAAGVFFALTENVSRAPIVAKADHVAKSFDEILYEYRLPRAVFYPHARLKVLLLEKIDALAEKRFVEAGYTVETAPKALSEDELVKAVRDVAILGIRSTTQVTKRVLEAAPRLLAVGAFCIGTNQIDLAAAGRRGVAVFNAPYANGRSVVELATGFIIALSRRLADKSAELHRGVWSKSAKGAHEVRGKTLGVVGYGNIGSQLGVVAEGLGMHVVFYDVAEKPAIGNAKRAASLDELLGASDFVSVHMDGRGDNKNFFNAARFAKMRGGAHFVNLSRGHIVDTEALAAALKSGHLGGAALDVFPDEPKTSPGEFRSPLQGIPNVILTPHIGGSTEEAQENIARYMSGKLISFIDAGDTALSVNMPNLNLPPVSGAHRFTHIHKNVPGVLANINAVMSRNKANILGQYLGTTNEIGYVITDANTEYEDRAIKELNEVPDTIRVRTLY